MCSERSRSRPHGRSPAGGSRAGDRGAVRSSARRSTRYVIAPVPRASGDESPQERLEIRGAELRVPDEGVIGLLVRADKPAATVTTARPSPGGTSFRTTRSTRRVTEGRLEARREAKRRLEPHLGVGERAMVQQHGDVDVALAMGPTLGVAAEEVGGHDAHPLGTLEGPGEPLGRARRQRPPSLPRGHCPTREAPRRPGRPYFTAGATLTGTD